MRCLMFDVCLLGVCILDVCSYSPKFTAYLARLLINYDYASMNWWERKTQVTATSGTPSYHTCRHTFHVLPISRGPCKQPPPSDTAPKCPISPLRMR